MRGKRPYKDISGGSEEPPKRRTFLKSAKSIFQPPTLVIDLTDEDDKPQLSGRPNLPNKKQNENTRNTASKRVGLAPAQMSSVAHNTPGTPSPTPSEQSSGSLYSNSPSAVIVDSKHDTATASMESMGFARADIDRAMRAAFFNPERAVEYLLTGIPESALQEQQLSSKERNLTSQLPVPVASSRSPIQPIDLTDDDMDIVSPRSKTTFSDNLSGMFNKLNHGQLVKYDTTGRRKTQRLQRKMYDSTEESNRTNDSQCPRAQVQICGTINAHNKSVFDKGTMPQPGPELTYDTCFGLLCMEATSSCDAKLPSECTPATLSFEGKMVRVYVGDGSTCVAILISEALSSLRRDFSVTLSAIICGKKARSVAIQGSKPESITLKPRICPVRIIVYGILNEKDVIADALSQAGLFLQHPGEADFDRKVKYFNPQYLLPPGEDMPQIENLNISRCCGGDEDFGAQGVRESLGELEKNEILRIFDSACDFDTGLTDTANPSPRLRTKLKRHQLEALTMMAEKETKVFAHAQFPALWEPIKTRDGHMQYQHIITKTVKIDQPRPMSGGILADEMGLGKTLSTLALVCHSLDAISKLQEPTRQQLPRATLVITPKSVIHNWEKQIKTHTRPGKVRWLTYHGSKRQKVPDNMGSYDIVLTTYDTLRFDLIGEAPVLGQEWARVILDEAHKIRNRTSKTFEAVCGVRARNRWCLTGTPIQNCLDDYGALLTFIGVPPFATKDAFDKWIVRPLISKGPHSLSMLRKLVAATCLRRIKANYASTLSLTRKTELLELVEMSSDERHLYEFFKRRSYLITGSGNTTNKSKGNSTRVAAPTSASILVLIGLLRLICNHGEALLSESALKSWKDRDTNSISWEMLKTGVRSCGSCGREIEDLDASASTVGEFGCEHIVCDGCALKTQSSDNLSSCLLCNKSSSKGPSKSLFQAESESLSKQQYPPSTKVQALLKNLAKAHSAPESEPKTPPQKSVIFSYWTKMLNLIAVALKAKRLTYHRIDGSSSLPQRKNAIEAFNSDPACNIMLASIGAAGEGIDLTAANTVHIVEPHWNPMAESQAVDRIHRIGQQRDVTVIRYIVKESIESYIQWIQMDKLRLIKESLSTSEQKFEKVEEARWKKLLEFLQ